MKFLVMIHGYPPIQNAGAEWMLHEMCKHLVSSGHKVEVVLPISRLKPYEFEGVQVNLDDFSYTHDAVKNCDMIITHLDRSGKAINMAQAYHKPVTVVIHNTNNFDVIRVKDKPRGQGRFVYCIYNSNFTAKELAYPNPSVVVHPPVDPKRYKVAKKGNKLTLINLFERKGSPLFHDLARLLPDYSFLGVEGGYGKQLKDEGLANVEYMANTSDAKKIYSKTRILLMPSIYESYGRTAIEAMSSGIPVIANPTPGLQESMGDAGIYCRVESPLSWIEAIKKLDDPEEYKKASTRALKRAEEVCKSHTKELNDMEQFLMDAIMKRL
jgi:glycosyltransferase involved in cell wall biosynthesis